MRQLCFVNKALSRALQTLTCTANYNLLKHSQVLQHFIIFKRTDHNFSVTLTLDPKVVVPSQAVKVLKYALFQDFPSFYTDLLRCVGNLGWNKGCILSTADSHFCHPTLSPFLSQGKEAHLTLHSLKMRSQNY